MNVEITVGRRLHAADPVNRLERARQFLSDRLRRLPQTTCELEGNWRRQVAELPGGWIFDWEGGRRVSRDLVEPLQRRQYVPAKTFVNWKNHEG